jgi:hypothetical protein
MSITVGCIGDQEELPEEEEEQENKTEGEESDEEVTTEESEPAKFEIIDLVVQPEEVSPDGSVTVTATVQNIGETEGTEQVEFDIDGRTVDEQKVGDTTFEEVTEAETVTKQVTVPPGESATVSISIKRELVGTFGVSVADHSVSFDVIREWNEIGEAYEGAGGLIVTLESFEVNEKEGSYEYAIEYTLENDTDGGIDEGGFQLYPTDPEKDPVQQFGAFDELFPGDTVSRSYNFEKEKNIEFSSLAYHPDQFFAQNPPNGALVWPVEY